MSTKINHDPMSLEIDGRVIATAEFRAGRVWAATAHRRPSYGSGLVAGWPLGRTITFGFSCSLCGPEGGMGTGRYADGGGGVVRLRRE